MYWWKSFIYDVQYNSFMPMHTMLSSHLMKVLFLYIVSSFFYLKPHYDNTLLTPLLQLFTLCFNHWEPQQLTASPYVHCLISMLTRERCEWRLMAGKDTESSFGPKKIFKYSDSYTNFLKIILITSFIFEVLNTHTRNFLFS